MPTAPKRWTTALLSVTLLVALAAPAGAETLPGADDPASAGGDGDTVDVVVHPAAGVTAPSAARDAARAATSAVDGRSVPSPVVRERSGVAVVSVPAARAEQAIAALEADPDVAAAEIDPAVTAFDETGSASLLDGDGPDDTRYPDQWALPHIDAPSAWGRTTGSDSVRIAVLDTGVDGDHPDLVVADGANFSDSGDADDADDRHGHGTHVAGIAAAATDNAQGVAGACWSCEVLPVKVLEDSGSGTQSQVAEGIHYAIERDADVIVMSLGGEGASSTLQRAVEAAEGAGVVMVAAAGNYNTEDAYYPAAFDQVIGVAAVDDDDQRASFSNHGDWVEVAAPGIRLDSTISDPNEMGCAGDYCQRSGTSMAAPVVGGVTALATTLEPRPDAAQIRAALSDTAVDVGDWVSGGRVDADAALTALADSDGGDSSDDGSTDDGTEDTTDGDDTDDGSTDDGSGDDGSTDDGSGDDGSTDDGDDGAGDPTLEEGVRRTAGRQRFATAARLSAETFDPGVERAYLATGTSFADALAAGAAAGAADGPVLLAVTSTLPSDTADELARLRPDEVVVVGGPQAISEDVRRAAERAAGTSSRRLAGSERFATAAAIAVDAFDPGGDVAYVATGDDFADALAGVPAAIIDGAPMLLSAGDQLPAATRGALEHLEPENIVALGGSGALSESVAAELADLAGSGGVIRLAGSTRFATASAIADRFDDAPGMFLATGTDFPDALAGGPVAGHHDSPLLLVAGDHAPPETTAQLERLAPSHLRLLGGTSAISERLFDTLRLSHTR